jgi:hypothetical protein
VTQTTWVNVLLGVVTAVMTVAAVVLVARTVARMVAIIRLGQRMRTGADGAPCTRPPVTRACSAAGGDAG